MAWDEGTRSPSVSPGFLRVARLLTARLPFQPITVGLLFSVLSQTLIANKETFQHMIRVANTNIDGKQKAGFALTSIKGIGRRFCNIALKKAEIDPTKRAGELTQEEIDQFMVVVSNPRTFKIPDYILNRRKDFKDGRYGQIISSTLDNKLREDLERLKKIRSHRGIRHWWGLKVRGQHTKTSRRRGRR